jgi:hypothetical protein
MEDDCALVGAEPATGKEVGQRQPQTFAVAIPVIKCPPLGMRPIATVKLQPCQRAVELPIVTALLFCSGVNGNGETTLPIVRPRHRRKLRYYSNLACGIEPRSALAEKFHTEFRKNCTQGQGKKRCSAAGTRLAYQARHAGLDN